MHLGAPHSTAPHRTPLHRRVGAAPHLHVGKRGKKSPRVWKITDDVIRAIFLFFLIFYFSQKNHREIIHQVFLIFMLNQLITFSNFFKFNSNSRCDATQALGRYPYPLQGPEEPEGAPLPDYGPTWTGWPTMVLGVCLSHEAECNDLQTHSEKRAVGLGSQGPPPFSTYTARPMP